MKGAKNLEEEEITELSREIKRGILKKLEKGSFYQGDCKIIRPNNILRAYIKFHPKCFIARK